MPKVSKKININIEAGSIIKIILIIGLFWVLYRLFDLVLIILTAVVIASAIEPMTKKLISYKIPRVISVIFIYLFIVSMLAMIIYFFIPPLLDDLSVLTSSLPDYIEEVDISSSDTALFSSGFSINDAIETFSSKLELISSNIFGLIGSIFNNILNFILVIVFSFYLAVQKNGIANFLGLVTPVKYEKYIIDLWGRSQKKIGLWLQGQLLLAVIVGTLVYLLMTLVGIKNALLLAIIAALFELIPIFGPIIASVPAIFLGFIDGGVSMALVVAGIYLIIQQFENQLIYPLVVKKVVGVSPIIAIIAIIAGAQLAGFWGVIISVPVASIMMEILNDIDKEKNIQRTESVK